MDKYILNIHDHVPQPTPLPTADPIATKYPLHFSGAAQLVSQKQAPLQRRLELSGSGVTLGFTSGPCAVFHTDL